MPVTGIMYFATLSRVKIFMLIIDKTDTDTYKAMRLKGTVF